MSDGEWCGKPHTLLGAGSVDQARAGRVRAAVLARFPGAAA